MTTPDTEALLKPCPFCHVEFWSTRRLEDAAANRISELEARVGVLEGALTKVADGKVPPDKHGHYLAHREAVKIARAALTPQEKDQGR